MIICCKAKRSILILSILILVAATSVSAYQGNLGTASTVTADGVRFISSKYPSEDCYEGTQATGTSDWATVCDLTESVTSCSENPHMPFCEVFHLCNGWVPDFIDADPRIELSFSPLANVTHVSISEQGSTRWSSAARTASSGSSTKRLT